MLLAILQVLVATVVVGGCAYYFLVASSVGAYLRHRRAPRVPSGTPVSFSVLKPLAGDEPGLEKNLESFYRLDYTRYELLFAARDKRDPALALAETVAQRNPGVRSATLWAGEPRCQNAKVHSLAVMTQASRGQVLVISDSDIRTDRGLLRDLAAEFQNPTTGVVTCPYRAVPGGSVWSLLEAVGINTELWGGVLVAQTLAPMDFAVGPTMAIRRSCLEAIGGWDVVEDMLAEDFRLGRLARRAGFGVNLGTHVVDHRIGNRGLVSNFRHRIRWQRSTRRSRPVGYVGQIFINPLPWALLLVAVNGTAWSWALLAICAFLRLLVVVGVGGLVLQDSLVMRYWWLVPLQDILSLGQWVGGFFGNKIVWRDRVYKLMKDGSLRRVDR